MTKKLLALLLCAAMLCSLLVFPAAAENDDVVLTITPNETLIKATGGSVEVIYTVTIAPKSGVKLGAFSFQFDVPEGMTLTSTAHTIAPANQGMSGGYWVNELGLKQGYDSQYKPVGYFTAIQYNPDITTLNAYGATNTTALDTEVVVMTIAATITGTGDFTLGITPYTGDGTGFVPTDVSGAKLNESSSVVTTPVSVYEELTGVQAVTLTGAPAKYAPVSSVSASGPNADKVVTTIEWTADEASFNGTNFGVDTVYTANIVLKPNAGYQFAAGATFTLNGETVTAADYNGSKVISKTFAATAKLDELGGTVDVTPAGPVAWGTSLTAIESVYCGTETKGTLTYQWYRGDTAIEGATAATYTTVEADIDRQITVQVANPNNRGTVTSNAVTVERQDYAGSTAVTPVLAERTVSSLKVTVVEGQEYAIGAGDSSDPSGQWNTTGEFTGLTAGTTYKVYTRVAQTDTVKASAAVSASFKTQKAITAGMIEITGTYTYDGTPKTPSYTVKDGNDTLSANTHYTAELTNNTDAGDAQLKITGMGDYTGEVTVYFTINPKPIPSSALTLGKKEHTTITKTFDNTTALAEGDADKLAVTVAAGTLVGADTVDWVISNAVYTNKAAGTKTVKADVALAGTVTNYAMAGGAETYPLTSGDIAEITKATPILSNYTSEASKAINIVVGKGTFTQPTYKGLSTSTENLLPGTFEITYTVKKDGADGDLVTDGTYAAAVAALAALSTGDTGTIEWKTVITAVPSNYQDPAPGTLSYTIVDIVFKVGEAPASAANAVTTQNKVYGKTWNEIVTVKTDDIVAMVGDDEVTGGEYKVVPTVSATYPVAGPQTYKVTYTNTEKGYSNVTVFDNAEVEIAKKPITVKADNKSKTFGQANPELTWALKAGERLVGTDTVDVLTVELTTAATSASGVGSYDITGTGTAANYEVTVEKGTLTVGKATITGITTAAPADKTLYASDADNTQAKVEGYAPLAQVDVTYQIGDDTTAGKATLPITWTKDKAYNVKGDTYTYTGALTVGENFAASDKTLTAKMIVTPVKVAAIAGMPEALNISKAQATAAEATLTGIGLPEKVTVSYDAGAADAELTAKFDKAIGDVKAAGDKVTAAEKQTVVVTLIADTLPGWATLPAEVTLPKTTVTITYKKPIDAKDITFEDIEVTYGTDYTPAAAVAAANYPGQTFTYAFSYVDSEGNGVDSPVNAGEYTMTVDIDSADFEGAATAKLTINRKELTDDMVTLEDKELTYTGEAQTVAVTVTDADAAIAAEDYDVAFADNTEAGTATVTVTAKRNYTGEVKKTFEIGKADVSELKPTVTGTAEVGKVLYGNITGVVSPETQLTWQWFIVAEDGTETAIEGATGSSFVVTEDLSDLTLAVKAAAKADCNYEGTTLASDPVTVAKTAVRGLAALEVDHTGGADAAKVDAGDVINVTGYLEPTAAREGSTWQWYRNGVAVEGASGTVEDLVGQVLDMSYTVTDADAGAVLTFVWTPNSHFTGSVEESIEVGKAVLTGSAIIVKDGETDPARTAAVGDVLKAVVSGAPEGATYDVVWCYDDEPMGATGESYTVAKADQGKTLHIQIVGTGDYTGAIRGGYVTVPAAAPDAPVASAKAGNKQITVSWKAPADNGAPVVSYSVYTVGEDTDTYVTVNATETSYVFTGLTNGTEYSFYVKAYNAMGLSEASNTVTAKPKAASAPSTPSTPDEPETPPEEEKPEPVVTENPDGSTTVTVTDPETGAVTETTTYPDGTEVEVVTTAEGAVTTTETRPDGVTVETETTAEGETTAVVTVPEEVEEVKATIPVKEPTPGTVVVIVHEDGTEEVVRMSVVTEDGVVLTLTESANLKIVDNTKTFTDVAEDYWAKGAVSFVSSHELFQGTGDGSTFEPGLNMSRGMLATVLFRLNGEHKGNVAASFADVEKDTWYTDGVAWAAEIGVVKGYNPITFAPNDDITREQLVTMIYRYAEYLGKDVTLRGSLTAFPDAAETHDWAQEAMEWAVGIGLIQGKLGGLLDPTGTATRGEVATVLERFVTWSVK